jgi:hypothetical protein
MINGLKVHGGGSPEPCWTGFESRTKLGAAPNTSAARKKINSRESTTTTRTLTGMELHRLLCFFFFFYRLIAFLSAPKFLFLLYKNHMCKCDCFTFPEAFFKLIECGFIPNRILGFDCLFIFIYSRYFLISFILSF